MTICNCKFKDRSKAGYICSKQFLLCGLLAVSCFFCNADTVVAAETHTIDSWIGFWSDGEGGDITVRIDGGFLRVDGRDSFSNYKSICLMSDNFQRAACQGDGVQIQSANRFLIRSEWKLVEDGFVEEWVADFTKQQLKGELKFSRTNERAAK